MVLDINCKDMELQLEIPSYKDTHLLKFDAKSANKPDFSILSLAYGQITLPSFKEVRLKIPQVCKNGSEK